MRCKTCGKREWGEWSLAIAIGDTLADGSKIVGQSSNGYIVDGVDGDREELSENQTLSRSTNNPFCECHR